MKTATLQNGKLVWDREDTPAEQEIYEARFEEMCRARRGPRSLTDDVAIGGLDTLGKHFEGDEKNLERLCRTAQAHGYNPMHSDVYLPALADFPGDPKAFVRNDVRAHVKKVCEAKGVPCTGMVEVKEGEKKPVKKVRLAKRLIEEEYRARVAKNPDVARKDKGEVTAQIVEDHALN